MNRFMSCQELEEVQEEVQEEVPEFLNLEPRAGEEEVLLEA